MRVVIGSGASMTEYIHDGTTWRQPVQRGTATIAAQTIAAGGGAAYIAVTFATAYAAPPKVVLNLDAGAGYTAYLVARALSVTAGGFSAYLYNVNVSTAAVLSSGVDVGWLAVG